MENYILEKIYGKLYSGKNILWFPYVFALGNKSGSFCEAVNCERSEQEGKFLFAMLVPILWLPIV